MQFSVIVEGSVGAASDSGNWEELERYLQSAKISPALVKQLQAGQPRILKNSLSYEQAVSISDRLADWGLESAIDPPVKPEQDRPTLENAAAQANTGRRGPAKTGEGQGTHKLSVASSPAPKVPQPSAATKPPSKTLQHTASPALGKAAQEVRALFSLPPSGAPQITLPRASRVRLWWRAALSIVIPGLPALLLAASILAFSSLVLALYAAVGNVSPLAGSLLLMAFTLTGLAGLALLTLPFWFGTRSGSKAIALKAKNDPRLFMLIKGICKLINAPFPSQVYLSPEPELRSSLRFTNKEFFSFNKPLEGELSLYLGSPLLASLSIRELSALIARECGRFAEPSFRRPYVLITGISHWLQACGSREPLVDRFAQPAGRIRSEVVRNLIYTYLRRADQVQGYSLRAIAFCEKQLSALLSHDVVADCYRDIILGENASPLQGTLDEIKSAHQKALCSMLQENHDQRYVNSLAALTKNIFEGKQTPRKRQESSTGLVRSTRTASTLLENFERQDQSLTRDFYQSKGLDSSSLRFMSLEELRRRKNNEAKLRKIAQGYYGSWLHPEQFWKMPGETFSERAEPKILMSRLNHCISRVRFMSPDRPQLIANYNRIKKQLAELKAAKKVLATGTSFRFQHCADAADDLDRQIAARVAKLKQYGEDLHQQNLIMGERIALGLALDQQHKPTVAKILKALVVLDSITVKLDELSINLEELSALQGYKPRGLTQHYHLHLKELDQSIESAYRYIYRKLQHCPYEFYDRRHPTLQALLDSRMQQAVAKTPGISLIEKARILEDSLRQAHKNISELAATYAARVERTFKVETVRRI